MTRLSEETRAALSEWSVGLLRQIDQNGGALTEAGGERRHRERSPASGAADPDRRLGHDRAAQVRLLLFRPHAALNLLADNAGWGEHESDCKSGRRVTGSLICFAWG